MPNIAINITGGSYKSRSKALSAQKTQYFYPELVDNPSAKSKYVLQPFPGLTLFGSETGLDRGMFEFQGILYKVTGTTLYSVDSNGTHSIVADIPGTAPCIMEGIGNNLMIVTEGKVYLYVKEPAVTDFIITDKFFNYSNESYSNDGFAISSDGTKMFILDGNAGFVGTSTVYQYTLGTSWDISTATYDSVGKSISSQTAWADGLAFSADGDYMYVVGDSLGTAEVFQYQCRGGNWDLSNAPYTGNSFDFTTEDNDVFGIAFNPDGTLMYLAGNQNDTIYEYTLSSAWDVSSAYYSGNSLSITSEDSAPLAIHFTSDGLNLFLSGDTNNSIYEYTLTTAWDLSTASLTGTKDVSAETTNPKGMVIRPDQTGLYLTTQFQTIVQYSPTGEILDTDLETPNSVAHLNNQAIYDGDDARWCTSDVGDATSINGLNYATAESDPDNLQRVYVFNQLLYLFGEKSTETWYNSGVGSPPFDRIEGGIIPIGLAAIHSTANNDNYLYFLADDNKVYTLIGSSKTNRSTIALSNEFESYTTVSDAIGSCYTFENQNFYELTFPTEEKTWVYSESTNQWFELSSDEGRYIGNSHAYAYRKNLVADYRNGNIYELDIDAYTENGTTIQRIRDTGPIHGELLGAPGKWVEMNRFELIMETGVGLSVGQGIDPVVMLSWSDDGGKTFSTEQWGEIGRLEGDYIKVEWFALGGFYSRIMRIKTSDPVFYSIHSANADMEVGI